MIKRLLILLGVDKCRLCKWRNYWTGCLQCPCLSAKHEAMIIKDLMEQKKKLKWGKLPKDNMKIIREANHVN